MISLGIDPGTATTGYGVIKQKEGNLICKEYGIIKTEKEKTDPERLMEIDKEIKKIFRSHRPDIMAIEKVYFSKNVKTAMTVSQAKGIAMLRAAKEKVQVCEFTPSQIKSNVAGHGNAEKMQVQKMIKSQLNLKERPRPNDAADGLGVAICGLQKINGGLS